jgi:glycosyltransferase involved in cell wall biosynthesis
LKILFFIDSLSSGGKERRLTELMKALNLVKDISFELAVMNYDVHYQEVFDLNIPIHYIVRKTKKDFTAFYKLFRLCQSVKPDIVHCWDSMTAVYSVPVCKRLKIPLINGMVIDSPQKQNVFNKYWFRAKLTFPFSDYIVGNSKAGIDAYNAPVEKSYIIHNGFDFSRTENLLDKNSLRVLLNVDTKFIIGMVATFSEYKDYKTYFKAAQLVLYKRNDVTFLAIGNLTDSALAKSLIEDNQQEHFRLLGKKTGIESYVNMMDVCVLSTFTEGISNSILEYMALGKPVVATSGGGTNEIIENNKTGILVEPSNSKELAEKVNQLLDDNTLRRDMGNAGKERIKKLFSIEAMLNEYISLYEEINLKS